MSFSHLPCEVIEEIIARGLNSPKDVVNFSITSKRFNKIANYNTVWKAIFMKLWPGLENFLCGDSFRFGDSTVFDDEANNNEDNFVVWKSYCKSMTRFSQCVEEMEFLHYGDYELDDCDYNKIDALCKEIGEATLFSFLYYSLENDDMTFRYYVRKILLHFLSIYLSKEWLAYFEPNSQRDESPASLSHLTKGALLFEQWLCPFEIITDSEICVFVSTCVDHARKYISQTQDHSHPCLSWNFESDDYIEDLSQKQEKCVIDAISYVFSRIYKFTQNENQIPFYNLENSFLHKVIKNNYGIPIVLCILFREAALKFGVQMDIVNYPNVMILRHKNKNAKSPQYSYYIPSEGGTERTFQELGSMPILNEETSTQDVLRRMSNNVLIVLSRQGEQEIHNLYIYQQHVILNSQYEARHKLVQKMIEMPESSNSDRKVKYPTPKLHSEHPEVLYSVGMIAHHRRYDYMCVIRGRDEVCKASQQWIRQMRVNQLPNKAKQPFYHVLVSDGSDRYAAQESLEVINPDVDFNVEITHSNVGKYFSSYIPNQMGSNIQLPVLKSYYIPNKVVSLHYPEDAKVTEALSYSGKLSDD